MCTEERLLIWIKDGYILHMSMIWTELATDFYMAEVIVYCADEHSSCRSERPHTSFDKIPSLKVVNGIYMIDIENC